MSSRVPAQRSLHLIDIENLIGAGHFLPAAAATALHAYRDLVRVADGDHEIVGVSSPRALLNVHASGFGGRIVFAEGHDGADRALLEVLMSESVPERFGKLYCASGDGIFAEAVGLMGLRGLHVIVVANSRGLAKRLRLAAGEVLPINIWANDEEAA